MRAQLPGIENYSHDAVGQKNEDEICTSSLSSSTIPLTSELRRHLNCCFQ